jgi:hypothetical protein
MTVTDAKDRGRFGWGKQTSSVPPEERPAR